MENKVLKPKIRFKGFTDTWEQRKLGKIANIIGGGTPSTLVSKYWNGDINWYSPVEIGDKIFVSSSQKKITQLGYEKSSAKLLPIGTVLFTSRAGIGNTAILAKEGCTNQGFQSIVPNKKEIDSYFIYSMTNQLKEYGEKIGAGSTFAEVSGKQMEEMPINIPKLEEQCKISQLFEKIDNLITLHQSKYDKLVNVKKALLEKMFPKDGKNVPEIRFKGFTDTWEQRKFKNYFDERNERTGIGEMISVTISSGIKKFSELNRYDSKPDDLSKYKRVVEGDIAYNSMRMWQGASGYSPYTGILSPAYTVIKPKDGISAKFFSYQIKRPEMIHQFELNSQGLTKDTLNLKFPAFSEIETTAPIKVNEQNKIAKLLEKVDNLITLHQHKLEKLKNMKKSLLNKMFI